MTFPDVPLDVHVDLFYDDVWNEHTSAVRGMTAPDGRIRISSRGETDVVGGSRSTHAKLTFNSADGTYSDLNPNSSLYRKIGRYTPIRIYLGTPHVAATNSDTDTTSHVAPSVTAPTDDGLLICAWAAPDPDDDTYTLPGGMTSGGSTTDTRTTLASAYENVTSSGATGTRTATYTVSEDYLAASVLLHGSWASLGTLGFSTSTGSQSYTAGQWVVVISYFGWDDVEDTPTPDFPWDSDGGGWILLADSGTVFLDDAEADYACMKVWAKRVRVTGDHTITIDNPDDRLDTIQSVWYRVTGAGDFDIRFTGEVASWPQMWDQSGNDVWVPIEASDVTRRINRNPPLKSAIFREVTSAEYADALVAYWPFEDDRNATRAAAGIGGVDPFNYDLPDVSVGAYTGFRGSDALPTCTGSTGVGSARIPRYSGDFYYRGLYAIPDAGLSNGAQMVAFSIGGGGTVDEVELEYGTGGSGTLNVRLFDPTDTELDSTGAIDFEVNGTQFLASVELVQDGADIDWVLFVRKVFDDGTVEAPGSLSSGTFTGLTLGTARKMWIGGGGTSGMSFGHQMIGTSQDLVFNMAGALSGWLGEHAGRRFLRLGREEGVRVAVVGDPDDTQPMGSQPIGNLVDLLQECAKTDAGLMYAPRQFRGLAMRTGRDLTNQTAIHTQTYTDGGFRALAYQEDDLYLRNVVSAASSDGDMAVVERTSGPLNTSDPEDDSQGIGRRETRLDVNTMHADVLTSRALWQLHLGTVEEGRWPRVLLHQVNQAWDDDLRTSARTLDAGDRWVMQSPPSGLPPEDVTQLVIGFQELMAQFEHDIELNSVPESPYHIADWDDDGTGAASLAQSDSATLNEDLDTTETGVDINCGAGPDWTHETDFGILVNGERMTVTAVGAASGTFPNRTQTLTVTRSVNGITKTHSTGDSVEWLDKRYIGL